MKTLPAIPDGWAPVLDEETRKPYYREIDEFLESERAANHRILPGVSEIFNALRLTPYAGVKVVILGQDPYPTPGHAHGLCFSVRPEVRPLPGSLRNIYRELRDDVGFVPPSHGCLESWARQGVLLLNTVLTVRAHQANSHQKRGWETFTDRMLEALNGHKTRVVFLLWGRSARKKSGLLTAPHHVVIESAHPSPLSARLFLGCRCFSAANRRLQEAGLAPVDWRIPEMSGGGGG